MVAIAICCRKMNQMTLLLNSGATEVGYSKYVTTCSAVRVFVSTTRGPLLSYTIHGLTWAFTWIRENTVNTNFQIGKSAQIMGLANRRGRVVSKAGREVVKSNMGIVIHWSNPFYGRLLEMLCNRSSNV